MKKRLVVGGLPEGISAGSLAESLKNFLEDLGIATKFVKVIQDEEGLSRPFLIGSPKPSDFTGLNDFDETEDDEEDIPDEYSESVDIINKGFAIVELFDEDGYEQAMRVCDGKMFGIDPIKVTIAREHVPREKNEADPLLPTNEDKFDLDKLPPFDGGGETKKNF